METSSLCLGFLIPSGASVADQCWRRVAGGVGRGYLLVG